MIGEFLTADERRLLHSGLNLSLGSALDKDFVKEILPYLGPDWGLCVTASVGREMIWVPTCVFALKVAPSDSAAPADQAIYSLVNFLAVGTVFAHNSRYPNQPMKLKTTGKDKGEVKYLESSRLPLGLRPAFGLAGGYLLVGSSPASLERFAKPATAPIKAPNGDLPLIRVSLREIRTYLKTNKELMVNFFVDQGADRAASQQRIDEFYSSLQLFDRVELRQRVEPRQVTFSVILRPTQPLRK